MIPKPATKKQKLEQEKQITTSSTSSTPKQHTSSDPPPVHSHKLGDSDNDTDSSGKTCIAPSRANLIPPEVSPRKKIKTGCGQESTLAQTTNDNVEANYSLTLAQIKKERLEKSEGQPQPCDMANTGNRENIANLNNNAGMSANDDDTFRVRKINLSVDNDETQTVVLTGTSQNASSV